MSKRAPSIKPAAAEALAVLDQAPDPVALAIAMCEAGRAQLATVATTFEATTLLIAFNLLEYTVKLRDLNQEAVIAASTIRILAERRVGELLAEQAAKGERQAAGGDRKSKLKIIVPDGNNDPPTLDDQGLTRKESATYQQLAAAPPDVFAAALDEVARAAVEGKHQITRAAVMRAINPKASRSAFDRFKDGDRFKRACDRVVTALEPALDAIRWGHFPGREDPKLFRAGLLASIRAARGALNQVEAAIRRQRR